MNRPNRNLSRFDYQGYHRTGEKTSKLDAQYRKLADSLDQDSIMERNQLVDKYKMIVLEIEGFLEEYELENLYGIEDIEKCISELKQLKKKFDEVHVRLRRVLGEEYEDLYKTYDYDVKKIADWIKESRREISKRKREEKAKEKEENDRKEKEEKDEVVRKEREEKEEMARKEKEEKEEVVRKEREEKEERAREREEIVRKEREEKEERAKEKEEVVRKEREEKEEKAKEKEEVVRKEREEKEEKAREKDDLARKVRDKIKAEEKYFDMRVEQCLSNLVDENAEFIEDIEKNISEVKYLMEVHSEIYSRIESEFGEKYEVEFGDKYRKTSNRMNQCIQDEKKKIKIIRQAEKDKELHEIEAEKDKELREIEAEKEKIIRDKKVEKENESEQREKSMKKYDEKISFIKYMFDEIKSSASNLDKRYSVSLKSLSDNQVFEKRSDIKIMDTEFNEILNKVTELVKEIPSQYNEEHGTLKTIFEVKDALRIKRDNYTAELEQEIYDRDLSSEKLQNASLLKIELPKFKGYNSIMDIYTFQTEFEKLISPYIQKKLLPDYLKNNYLEGQALMLVKEIVDIKEIWNKLKESFGDTMLLLQNKLSQVEKYGPIWKIRDNEKLIPVLSRLVNAMSELKVLVDKHSIGDVLYHPSNLGIIYDLIGVQRNEKFTLKNMKTQMSSRETWDKLMEFLKGELRFKERLVLNEKSRQQFSSKNNEGSYRSKDSERTNKSYVSNDVLESGPVKCYICGKDDHVISVANKGKRLVHYIACEKFVKMKPSERFRELMQKNLCFQCLYPGAKGRHDGVCYNQYACKHESHSNFNKSKHVLVCEEHKNDPDNMKLFDEYKLRFVTNSKSKYKDFSQNMKLSFYAGGHVGKCDNEQLESSIYLLQTIKIEDKKFNLFYDSGCGDLISRKSAVIRLEKMGRACRELRGPIILTGVGDNKTVCEHGIYKVKIPMFNGKEANISGLCLDKVTQEFPNYELQEVAKDIQKEYEKSGTNSKEKLPKLPRSVGGNTDFMIGIKYLKYFPKEIFQLPSGLTIYESVFLNADGSRGVIGGPHRIFAEIERRFRGSHLSMAAYLNNVVASYKNGYRLSLDVPLLGMKYGTALLDNEEKFDDDDDDDDGKQVAYCHKKRLPGDPAIHDRYMNDVSDQSAFINRPLKLQKKFEEVECAGTEVLYRCIKCRDCVNCKTSEQIEYTSIQEEVEQDLINRSVTVDIDKGQTIAKLPFLKDPVHRLSPNEKVALKIYKSQVRKLENCPEDMNEVIKSEKKLQELGFVEFFERLTDAQKLMISESSIKHFIPWRAVWNGNSISTPCRLVFDASQKTNSEYSLNSLLAKGRNNMNKLVEIVIRWMIHKYAFHTDIQKMYNSIKLKEEHWCYQLYLWDDKLSSFNEPQWKVIKTLIYGVKSSGNQAERGLRETANLLKDKYPRENEIINKDIYVDDCLSGENSLDMVRETTDNLKLVLNRGGFCLKGLTFSGLDPPKDLSSDGVSLNVAGMKWFPKQDNLALNIGELNFEKKKRGKKPVVAEGIIPENFTRRDCVGKVAEIFDLLGKITPITAGMKLDLSELCNRKLHWDDIIPDDLKGVWKSNFAMMREIEKLRFNRTVIPEDAVNLEIETIDTGDASNSLVCAAIYARIKRKNGAYSSQLVFSRSKIVPKDMTMPRAELFAAVLNASTGHVVKLSFGKYFKKCIKLTDSQIVLHWISNSKLAMKQWVRNRVIEINRLTSPDSWRYVKSKDMIADLGTRKGVKIEDVSENSLWINGYSWMRSDERDFPTKTVGDIKLTGEEIDSHDSECLSSSLLDSEWLDEVDGKSFNNSYLVKSLVPSEVKERYQFSNYIIDPNKFRLRKVVRILALVMLFIRNMKIRIGKTICKSNITNSNIHSAFKFELDRYLVTGSKTGSFDDTKFKCKEALVVSLTDSDIQEAMKYFYKKSTLEIKSFLNQKAYQNISKEIDGILYYTGRILPSQEFNGKLNLCDVSIDLSSASFCVPLTDSLSPFAYSVVNETHWYNNDAKHSGVETVLRYSQKIAYIIEGRGLVKKFRKDCVRCRILAKKAIEVAMGPIHSNCLNIAPAFFISQVDIFGPVNSYSNVNKRATVKIWFVIFCCCVTGAIDLKTMEDYSTESFLLGFMRFACRVGYPKKLMPDEGSQLVKGCNVIKLEFYDIKHKLNERYGVEFETCPVGAHYMHGKVERKIRHVQESFTKTINGSRLSMIQWETLGDQVANSVNNQPIAIGNIVKDVENLDILTPNRLMLGRNNDRSPIGTLIVTNDPKRIIKANNDIFDTWFKCWLISYVPTLTHQPKWFNSDRDTKIGDVILFLKSDKEFDKQYQYGMVIDVKLGKDGKIREIDIEYRNHNEVVNRYTNRGTRDVIVIHPVDELSILGALGTIAEPDN